MLFVYDDRSGDTIAKAPDSHELAKKMLEMDGEYDPDHAVITRIGSAEVALPRPAPPDEL